MSAPYWDIRRKVQDAVAAYLITNSAGVLVASEDWADSPTLCPVRKGFTADDVDDLPMVAVIADKSSRYLPEVSSQVDNTREVSVRVVIKTGTDERSGNSGDTPAEEYHNDLVARVYDLLNNTSILAGLAAVAPADCTIQALDLGDESQDVDGNILASTHELTVVAMPQ